MSHLRKNKGLLAILLSGSLGVAAPASAGCNDQPSHAALKSALKASVSPAVSNGGFNLQMWATMVDRDGQVCHVTFSGNDRGAVARQPRDFGLKG